MTAGDQVRDHKKKEASPASLRLAAHQSGRAVHNASGFVDPLLPLRRNSQFVRHANQIGHGISLHLLHHLPAMGLDCTFSRT